MSRLSVFSEFKSIYYKGVRYCTRNANETLTSVTKAIVYSPLRKSYGPCFILRKRMRNAIKMKN